MMKQTTAQGWKKVQRAALAWLVAVGLALNVGLATTMPLLADAPAPEQSIANYEVRFMEEMIDHHAMAVMMGELCLEKAVHEELRTMCEEIIAAQTQEIETMQSWLQEWYGLSYEPQMKPGDMQQMEKLAATSGEEFEIMFMEMMIKHHAKAIKQATKCTQQAYHDALVDMCENIIVTQQAEIEQMQTWLCDWYGICKE